MKKQWVLIGLAGVLLIAAGACRQQEEPAGVTALPDLMAADVSCMGGNIYITVKNQGDGGLPDDWHSLMALYIEGTAQQDILLSSPTRTEKGGISEPGGISHYLIPYDVPQPLRLDIYVDYTEEIDESDEKNNSLENVYIGPCLLPNLAVEDIYLNENCRVVVVIKNLGPGSLPQQLWTIKDVPECTLKILVDKEEYVARAVFEFDPQQALAPVEGTAVFPSDLEITEESAVTAVIECMDIVREQDQVNNTLTKILSCDQ